MRNSNNNTNFAGTRDAANHAIRFDIRQGKLAQWMGLGQQRREYDYVQGRRAGISLRKHELPSGEMTYMDIHCQNGETRFDVSALASGSVAVELISKLVNIRDLKSMIRIDVWAKDRYTNGHSHRVAEYSRMIAREAGKHLKNGGKIFLEIGCDEGASVSELLENAGFGGVRTVKDLAGKDRVVAACWNNWNN